MKDYVLYKHTNKINGKVYYGITNNITRRWRSNGIEYKPQNGKNTRPLWNAIQKYGFDSFEHDVIIQDLTFKEACEKEKEYIELYKTTNNRIGYNIAIGGNGGLIYSVHPKGMKGKHQTDYQKESHSKWASDCKNNCMKNGSVVWGKTHKHPRGMLGKTHSDEYRQRVSEFMTESHPNFKRCYAVMPDGLEIEFKSPKFLCEHFKIPSVSSSIYQSMKKGPYVVMKASRVKRYDLEGITIIFESPKLTPR